MNNSRNSTANFDTVIEPKQATSSYDDILTQAYYAGFITKYATLVVYGTGSERGTYGQFANVSMKGTAFANAKFALTYFTDLYSTALRNQGKTARKKSFYLSQLQEIQPLLDAFGLSTIFEQTWEAVKEYDKINNLVEEHKENNRISDWETRTLKKEIPFEDYQLEILEAVTKSIMSSFNVQRILKLEEIADPEEVIQLAFIEGLRGLSMGHSDMDMLRDGMSIMECFKQVA